MKSIKNLSLLTVVVFTAILVIMPAAAWANVLFNPCFETGDLTGWTKYGLVTDLDGWIDPPRPPGSSGVATRLQNEAMVGYLSQQWSSGSWWSVGSPILASVWFRASPDFDDDAYLRLEFINGSTPSVDFKLTGNFNTWMGFILETTVPSGTTMVRYNLALVHKSPSNVGYAYFDGTYLDVIPEPASLLLLGSGLIGLFALKKRTIK